MGPCIDQPVHGMDGAELLLALVRALARAAAREAFAAGTEAPDVPATGGDEQAASPP